MKKNKFMRLASVMLMLCLITTCAISGTFAKYTTSASATDQARVAKWGVTVTMMAEEQIFATQYKDEAIASGGTVIGGNNDTDVVAPGTYGTLSTIDVTGTPEVTVDVTTNLKLNLSNWTVTWDHDNDGGTTPEIPYCPIVFEVDGVKYGMKGIKDYTGTLVPDATSYTTIAELETAVINAILTTIYGDATDTVAGTTPYETKKVVRYTPNHTFAIDEDFSWEWAFDSNVDAKDTALGNLSADTNPDNNPEIDFAMQVIVEQVD